MSKAFLVLPLLIGLSAQAADIRSLKCERDTRPVDGPYESLEILQNEDGKYDVYYELKTAGFGFPVEESKVLIAKNLGHCTVLESDTRVLSCYKSASEEGEQTNSGIETSRVSRVTTEGSSETIDIVLYSPQLVQAKGKPGFPHMDGLGRAEFSFSAEQKPGTFMINHCTVSE